MQLRITNFCVRGFIRLFWQMHPSLQLLSLAPFLSLYRHGQKIHCFHPLPSARLPAPNLKKRGGLSPQPRTGSFQQRRKVGSTVRPQVSNRGSGRESLPLVDFTALKVLKKPQILLGDFMLKGI